MLKISVNVGKEHQCLLFGLLFYYYSVEYICSLRCFGVLNVNFC